MAWCVRSFLDYPRLSSVSPIQYICCRLAHFLFLLRVPKGPHTLTRSVCALMCVCVFIWYIHSLNLLWAPINPERMLKCDSWKTFFHLLRYPLTSFFRAPIKIFISLNKAFNYWMAVIYFLSCYPEFNFLLK